MNNIELITAINDLDTCTTVRQIDQTFHRYINQFGYDLSAFALISTPRTLRLERQVVWYHFPDAWRDHYLQKQYAKLDPVLAYLGVLNEAFFWEELDQLNLDRQQKILMKESQQAGLHHGMAIPLYGPLGELACISVASSNPHLNKTTQTLRYITVFARQVYDHYRRLHKNKALTPTLKLPGRIKRMVPYLALSRKNIADKMGISANTVDDYFKELYRMLNVNSNVGAIEELIKHGLYHPKN